MESGGTEPLESKNIIHSYRGVLKQLRQNPFPSLHDYRDQDLQAIIFVVPVSSIFHWEKLTIILTRPSFTVSDCSEP